MIGANLSSLIDPTSAPTPPSPLLTGPDPGVGSVTPGVGIGAGIPVGTGLPQPPPTPVPLPGAGWAKYHAYQLGNDIIGNGTATQFGGGSDTKDNSLSPSGKPITASEMTVSLPTGTIPGTSGSPFHGIPQGTQVEVNYGGKKVLATVGDDGPTINDQDDSGQNGTAMIDLSPMVAKSLGFKKDESLPVTIRIPGGAQHLGPINYGQTSAPDDVVPSDAQTLSQIGKLLQSNQGTGGKPPYDVDPIQQLVGKLQSGSLQNNYLTQRLSAHLDEAQNNEDTNPSYAKSEFHKANQLYQQMVANYNNAGNLGKAIDPAGILGFNAPSAPPVTRGQVLGAALQNAVGTASSTPPVTESTTPPASVVGNVAQTPPPVSTDDDTPDTPTATSAPAATPMMTPNVPSTPPTLPEVAPPSLIGSGQPSIAQSNPFTGPQVPQAQPMPQEPNGIRQYLAGLGDVTQDPEYPQLAQSKALLAQKLAAVSQARNDLAGLDIPDKPAPRDYNAGDALKAGLLALPSLFLKGQAGTSWLANSLSGYANAHNKDLDTSDQRDYQKAYAQKQAALQNASQDAQQTQQDIQDVNNRINHRQQLQGIALQMAAHAKQLGETNTTNAYKTLATAKTSADVDAATANLIRLGEDPTATNNLAQSMKASIDSLTQGKGDLAKQKITVAQATALNRTWQEMQKNLNPTGGISQAQADTLNTQGRRNVLSNYGLLPQGFDQMSHSDKMAALDQVLPPAQVGQTIAAQGLPSLIGQRNAATAFMSGPRTAETNAQTGHLNALTDLTKTNNVLEGLKAQWLPYLDQATIDHIGAGIQNQNQTTDQHNLTSQLAVARALYTGANEAANRIVSSHLGVPAATDKNPADYNAYQAALKSRDMAKQNVNLIMSAMTSNRGNAISTLPPVPSQPSPLPGNLSGPIGKSPKVHKTSKGTKYRVIP